MVRWEGVADRETINLDSLGLDLARLAVLVAFVHDDVAHDGLKLMLGISVAEILKGLLQPCWRRWLGLVSSHACLLCIITYCLRLRWRWPWRV
jgi:hypothetical protein